MTTYETDRLYLATVRGEPNVQVYNERGLWVSTRLVKRMRTHADRHITDVRPAVVLDPRRYAVGLDAGFLHWLADGPDVTALQSTGLDDLADEIERQTKPPIPDEPPADSIAVDKHGVGWWVEDDELLYPIGYNLPPLAWGELWDKRGPVKVVYRPDKDKP